MKQNAEGYILKDGRQAKSKLNEYGELRQEIEQLRKDLDKSPLTT